MSQCSNDVNLSLSLLGLIKNVFTPQQIKLAYQKLAVRMAQYISARETDAKNTAMSYQQLVDLELEQQKKMGKLQKVSCKKGCTFCCEQSVLISKDEADLIASVVEQQQIPFDSERLNKQSRFSPKDWITEKPENRRCVFLSELGSCRIYDFRPMSCRKHLSMDEPKKCDRTQSDLPEMCIVPEAEIIASAVFSTVGSGNLAQMLAKRLPRKSPPLDLC